MELSTDDKFFLNALSVTFPKLTPTELKVCLYLSKGLNTKETAKALYLAPRSIDAHRYRVRFKLRLKTEQNLMLFLLRFEQEQQKSRFEPPKSP
jgi:DNA-binding CsgD family transcriptional regulator